MSRKAPGSGSSVTLRDIANRVGLSASAVSMALLDNPRIGADTKLRVRRAAADLGYVPNSAGRALRAQRSDAIALVVPNTSQHVFGHAYFMHVLTGVTGVANERDAHVIISTNPDESNGMAAYERVLRSGSVDGAIVTSASVTDENVLRLVQSGVPVVLLGRFPYLPDAMSVGIDDVSAAFVATEHLITRHGRRTLAHISGPLDHQSAIDRRDGFLAAAKKFGVDAHVLIGDYSEESGARAAVALRGLPGGTDGVFAANDEMAYGAITHLRSERRSVPTEISFVGFDDFGLSRVTTPSISTMHVPAEHMARLATQRLFDLVAGLPTTAGNAHAVLPVQFVARQSCGC